MQCIRGIYRLVFVFLMNLKVNCLEIKMILKSNKNSTHPRSKHSSPGLTGTFHQRRVTTTSPGCLSFPYTRAHAHTSLLSGTHTHARKHALTLSHTHTNAHMNARAQPIRTLKQTFLTVLGNTNFFLQKNKKQKKTNALTLPCS